MVIMHPCTQSDKAVQVTKTCTLQQYLQHQQDAKASLSATAG